MKNVIVAGVSGTTGRLVAQNLCDAGFSPIALVRDLGKADDIGASAVRRATWPAAGFVDTEIRCLTELESWNAKKEVQPRVQA